MNDTLIGAIVGASAAILGSIIGGILAEVLKNILHVKRENRNNLLIAYENAKRLIFAMLNKECPDDQLIMETKIKMSIFAPKKTNKTFEDVIDNLTKTNENDFLKIIDEFNKLIKADLKI